MLSVRSEVDAVTFGIHTLVCAAAAVLIDFQAIAFALFAQVFAVTEGLLPADVRLDRLFDVLTLESGLLAGGVMVAAGLIAALFAVGHWSAANFGPLDPAVTMRRVIPAVTLLTSGCRIVLTSFFLGVLGLRRK